ncbi:hypothetical protein [endosymbiont GvMRE of Glomus versiforme]|uniref:hypothetical protein n=1 Tax=endosymbiont GvMRE of Glomus versiforme TaxID=2039283 RepID=UPI000EC52BE2|nr:hypothetical protein [endosymbiont GvMRE of Glomus versiforme]RHZ36128.1 hypothetical protein GvMRE_Ic2g101 [endosymbiont GvMRE of Glomus versiforme]
MESSQIQLTPTAKLSRHGRHKNLNYHKEYYRQNRKKLLTHSHDYYEVKKLLKDHLKLGKKETKIGVKKNFSLEQACDNIYNNLSLNSRYCLCWQKALDRKDIRVLTKGKVPQRKGWPWIYEKLTAEELLKKYGEWGTRTGKRIGNKWYVIADLDLRGLTQPLCQHLDKNFLLMKKRQGIKHIRTKRGYHDIFLLDELPPNGAIYHTDKFGVRRKIGDILAVGRQAQALGSIDKEEAGEGKWAWQAKNIQEISEIWGKYFLEIECEESHKFLTKRAEKKEINNINPNESQKSSEKTNKNTYKLLKLESIRIINKQSTKRANHYRVNYLDKWLNKSFFFLDSYFRDKKERIQPNLITNLVLAQGYKYQFYLNNY